MINAGEKEPSVPGAPAAAAAMDRVGASCLGRTCLKWNDDGELSDRDAQLILQRLSEVDRQALALLERLPERVMERSLGIG